MVKVPTRNDMMWPILKALENKGGSAYRPEIMKEVIRIMQLSQEILNVPHEDTEISQSKFDWEYGWACNNLKHLGAVNKLGEGKWGITDSGRQYKSAEEVIAILNKQRENYHKGQKSENVTQKEETSELTIRQVQEEILKYFLQHRKNNPDFTFALRAGHGESKDRFEQGYWFLGTDDYVFAPLFFRNDDNNKTKTIGFVYAKDGTGKKHKLYIEIVFSNITNSTEADVKFHNALVKKYNAKKGKSNRYFIPLVADDVSISDIKDNLFFYVNEFRNTCMELLKQHALDGKNSKNKDLYIISEKNFLEKFSMIQEYRNGNVSTQKIEPNKNVTVNKSDKKIEFIQRHKNVIFYGAPGTGKTYMLNQLKQQFANRCKFITFHQNYGYEDFIEGLKPELDSENVSYHIEDGIFKQICDEAMGDPDSNYAIFIDEINRGNISKIFGELITLIEVSKRLGEPEGTDAILPYSKKQFGVPANLFIIGAMNTADKSIQPLDTALRRRFKFVEMTPQYNLLPEKIEDIDLRKMLATINNRIEYLYDRDHVIGHSYLMKCETVDELAQTFKHEIIPLMQEYFYNDWEKIQTIFNGNGFVVEKSGAKPEQLFNDDSEIDTEKTLYEIDSSALKITQNYIDIYTPSQQ